MNGIGKITGYFVFSLFFLATMVYGESKDQTTSHTPATKPKNLFFCPPIGALKKDPIKLTWSASDGWQSYDISFDTKITVFYGAQWNGARVGQITCLYKGNTPKSFPILLAFNTLTYEPSSGQWSKNLGGYRNCVTQTPANCPFVIRTQPPEGDIYKEAEKLKSNSNDE